MNASQAIPFPLAAAIPEAAREQPFDRALAVLDAVTGATRPISVTDIAGECGLPVPTVHRLVAQLEKRGLLKRVLGSKKLVVGFGLVRLGIAALEAALRTDRQHQILVAFANQIGEHCQIGLRSDNAVLYIDTAKAIRSNGLHFEQGRRAPLHCASIGKLYLAEMSATEFEWWLSHAPLESLAPRTIVSPAVLRTVVRNVKKHGWAMSNQEIAAGVVGCAVPIRDLEGRLLAGLGLSVPSARVSFEELSRFRPAMASAAAEIAAAVSAEN
jgi:DNA-binding IclR family transcriptional regulator